jgi:PIN domain
MDSPTGPNGPGDGPHESPHIKPPALGHRGKAAGCLAEGWDHDLTPYDRWPWPPGSWLNWQELADIDPGNPVRLVVPVLVVEELDELKRGRDRARDRARSVLRRLWELNSDGKRAAMIPGSRPVTIEVLADDSWHMRRPVNDNEIIERALFVGEVTNRHVILAAADYSMLYQASSAGLRTALVDRPDQDTARLEDVHGISPKQPPGNGRPASTQSLLEQIRYHYTGYAESSTLRKTLGCLLAGGTRKRNFGEWDLVSE